MIQLHKLSEVLTEFPEVGDKLLEWRNSPHVRVMMNDPERFINVAEHQAWIKRSLNPPMHELQWVVFDSDSMYPIGYCHLNTLFNSFGLYIGDIEFLGKGYGKAIMQELIAIATKEGLDFIEDSVSGLNEAGIKLYESLGFELYDVSTMCKPYFIIHLELQSD